MISHQQADLHLADGSVWIKMPNGRYWKVRRNGATKTWKRDPFRWRIPVKAGMYVYSELTNDTQFGTFDSDFDVILCRGDANGKEECELRRAFVADRAAWREAMKGVSFTK